MRAAARAAGIVIYCIGLIGADGIDVDALNDWATDPDASHVAVTPDESDLEQLFADLAKNISKPGATNIVIDEIVNSDFTITSITPPNRGTAVMINSQTIRWTIQELGVTGNEGASLEFFIQHTAQTSGMKLVNESITYTDTEGNAVTFPAPGSSQWIVACGQSGAVSHSGRLQESTAAKIPSSWTLGMLHWNRWAALHSWM